jgi:hypothetical protein
MTLGADGAYHCDVSLPVRGGLMPLQRKACSVCAQHAQLGPGMSWCVHINAT